MNNINIDDVLKLVAAVGVIICVILQKRSSDKHDATQQTLTTLLGILTQKRRSTDPRPQLNPEVPLIILPENFNLPTVTPNESSNAGSPSHPLR